MNKEIITAKWFKTRYTLNKNGWLQPLRNAPVEYYDPFNPYINDNGNSDNLYLLFTNLDIEKGKEIENFYNRFGPLGLMSRDFGSIYPMPKDDQMTAEKYKEEELFFTDSENNPVPFETGATLHQFDAAPFINKFRSDGIVPELTEIQQEAGENVELFKWEHLKFRSVIDLYTAIQENEIHSIQNVLLLLDSINNTKPMIIDGDYPKIIDLDYDVAENHAEEKPKAWWTDKNNNDVIRKSLEELMLHLNREIGNRPFLKLVFDPVDLTINKSVRWRCESLLNAMYIMLINNITEGLRIKRCIGCGKYYHVGRPEMKYCELSCQNRAKMRRYQEKIRRVQDLSTRGMEPEEIARELNAELKQVLKWISAWRG
ncbi:MAG: hypothetical protein PHF24_06800 [Syntrophomonas sp.]|nr:hypothetical protein [Syntrophomonas sp.]